MSAIEYVIVFDFHWNLYSAFTSIHYYMYLKQLYNGIHIKNEIKMYNIKQKCIFNVVISFQLE